MSSLVAAPLRSLWPSSEAPADPDLAMVYRVVGPPLRTWQTPAMRAGVLGAAAFGGVSVSAVLRDGSASLLQAFAAAVIATVVLYLAERVASTVIREHQDRQTAALTAVIMLRSSDVPLDDQAAEELLVAAARDGVNPVEVAREMVFSTTGVS